MIRAFSHHGLHSNLDNSFEPPGKGLRPAGQQPRVRRCPPPVHVFTGREDILAQMHECFFNNSKSQRVFILYGLGGAGKTQIALKFVEMCQDDTVPRSVPHHSSLGLIFDLWLCIGSQISILLMPAQRRP